MKFFVTGALGHIGSRLIREFPGQFPEVPILMLDNLATQRYISLFDLPAAGRFRFFEGDIRSFDFQTQLQPGDIVIHLAALTHPGESHANETEVRSVNVEGTRKVAEACAACGARLVFISTTSVYGRPEYMSPYTKSKWDAEKAIQQIAFEKKLRFVILRFGTIFGVSPGMRFHTAVNKFCWQAAWEKRLSIWEGALDQLRPYLDLEDAVSAVAFITERNFFDERIRDVVTENTTVRRVVDLIAAHIPELSIGSVRSAHADPSSYQASNQRMVEDGFCFHGNLEKGIRETIALLSTANPKELFLDVARL